MGERQTAGGFKDRRGFASMTAEKQRQIASSGGRAAHIKGTAHEWTSDEARAAGRKGGSASRGGRGKVPPGATPNGPGDVPPRIPPGRPKVAAQS